MPQVVFARDRRRQKNRAKAIVFLMAVLCLFIGIGLSLKSTPEPQAVGLKENQPPSAHSSKTAQHTPNNADESKQSSLPLASTENIAPVATFSTNVALMMLSASQQDDEKNVEQVENTAMAQGGNQAEKTEPNEQVLEALSPDEHDQIGDVEGLTYINIQEGELDEQDFLPSDEKATSYEDEFIAEDDIDDETIEKLQQEATEIEQKTEKKDQQAQKEAENEKLPAETEKALDRFLDVADQAIRIQNQFSYTVARNDKLKDVLEQSGIGATTARVLEKKFPQLANLTAGQQFYWVLGKDGELEYMNWLVSEKEEKIFERKSKNQFSVQTIEKKGVWKQDVVKGTLNGDFTSSLKAQGLSSRQINQLATGIQWQIATNKLKKGDKYVILVKREYINGKVTELGNVEAIKIVSGNKSYYAIQADNGRYYSRHGETLGKGFARYPLQFTPRVSSQFNPRRRHPVTRRIAPHKGVDFGVPSGTTVIAPADGVVEHVAYQANGAGRYIKVRHGGQYTTVYMHLTRSLVHVGQSVKKGERIAISGNTGRSTGPHLHYEFHINGHPVNPLSVKLPGTGSGMAEKDRKAFLAKAKMIEAKLKL